MPIPIVLSLAPHPIPDLTENDGLMLPLRKRRRREAAAASSNIEAALPTAFARSGSTATSTTNKRPHLVPPLEAPTPWAVRSAHSQRRFLALITKFEEIKSVQSFCQRFQFPILGNTPAAVDHPVAVVAASMDELVVPKRLTFAEPLCEMITITSFEETSSASHVVVNTPSSHRGHRAPPTSILRPTKYVTRVDRNLVANSDSNAAILGFLEMKFGGQPPTTTPSEWECRQLEKNAYWRVRMNRGYDVIDFVDVMTLYLDGYLSPETAVLNDVYLQFHADGTRKRYSRKDKIAEWNNNIQDFS